MNPFQKILYATDFSESSEKAADYARHLAQLTGGHLHVLHVIGELSDPRKSRLQPEVFALLEREVEIQAMKDMHDFCQQKFEGVVPYASEVVLGVPIEQILNAISALPADLVVMGTHGRTGLEHLFTGSTAERVVRHSPVPVLTVRAT
ncbi:MAG: universal stress protein [Desulfuromonadales bacterium]|nr:universal stress protein [Desulfuromonadales bacterium]